MRVSRRHVSRDTSAGYTLLEALVTLFIIAEILVAVLVLFDFNSRVGRTQNQVAELQQTQRVGQNAVVQLVRTTGRGGLGRGDLPGVWGETIPDVPGGLAISVRTDLGGDGDPVGTTEIVPDWPDSPRGVPGTDVLTVRGVLTNPLWFFSSATSAISVTLDAGVPASGQFQILRGYQPVGLESTGVALNQDFTALEEAIAANRPEALLLTSASDASVYAIVELIPGASVVNATNLIISFAILGGTHSDSYTAARPFPVSLANAYTLAILEEYRIYLREPTGGFDLAGVGGDPDNQGLGRRSPELTMARTYPFTNVPYANDDANLAVGVAENLYDLQIALGIDLNGDGEVTENADLAQDEWLGNHESDLALVWNPAGPPPPRPPLLMVRLTTLGITDRPDPGYRAPTHTQLEDHIYADDDIDVINAEVMTSFRRRVLQTQIDLRGM